MTRDAPARARRAGVTAAPDWRNTIANLDAEVAKLEAKHAVPIDRDAIKLASFSLGAPLWWIPKQHDNNKQGADTDNPFSQQGPSAPKSCIILWRRVSSDRPIQVDKIIHQLRGTISRCIPLLLAEHIHLFTQARPSALLPIVANQGSVVSRARGGGAGISRSCRHRRRECDFASTPRRNVAAPPQRGRFALPVRFSPVVFSSIDFPRRSSSSRSRFNPTTPTRGSPLFCRASSSGHPTPSWRDARRSASELPLSTAQRQAPRSELIWFIPQQKQKQKTK